MRCPVCLSYGEESTPRCEVCGLSLDHLDSIFSAEETRVGTIVDENNVLNHGEISLIRTFLQDFHQAFPQLILVVYLGHIPGKMEIGSRETAFWLANRARPSSFSFRHRRASLLLYVDVQQLRAVLTAGYGFNDYLSEEDLKLALNQGKRYLQVGDYARGVLSTLTVLTAHLISKAQSHGGKQLVRR